MSRSSADTPFTVGLEEELLLVDAETLGLRPDAARVLAAMDAPADAAGHEAYAAELELRSPPSASAAEAVAALAGRRARAAGAGATLLGAGLHPSGRFGDAALVEVERYRQVDEAMRGLIRRTPECALHVHVGMPDLETAVRAFNGVRRRLPLLQGLAANSPWWFGVDSGLASARAAQVRSYPGRGVPRALRDVADWEETVAAALAAGDLRDATFLWWDVRLHPRFGTVEVRELDAQSSLEHVAALAALVRALAVEAARASAQVDEPREALDWSAFRAARDGVSASILCDGELRPLAELARATVERLRPLARELGDEDALAGVEELLATGGGAGRQRTAFARGGLRALLELLVEETAATPALPGTASEVADDGAGSVAREWLEARARCDLDRVGALTSEQAVWESPVLGTVQGRDAVVEQVRAGFADTDVFATELLALECRGEKAIAVVRNTGRREGERLDSLQSLFIRVREGRVASVRIAVDDPEAVEAFWSS